MATNTQEVFNRHKGFFSLLFVLLSFTLLAVTYLAVQQQRSVSTRAAAAGCPQFTQQQCNNHAACKWNGTKCIYKTCANASVAVCENIPNCSVKGSNCVQDLCKNKTQQAACLAADGCIWKSDNSCRSGGCADLTGASGCHLNKCTWGGSSCRALCSGFNNNLSQCGGDCEKKDGKCVKKVSTSSKVKVTVAGSGNGAGTVKDAVGDINCTVTGGNKSGNCAKDINKGGSFSLTATAKAGSTFTGWTGACTGTAKTCTKNNVNADATATAKFTTGSTGKVKVTVVVTGQGVVKDQVGNIECGQHEDIVLSKCSKEINNDGSFSITANADEGWKFSGWTGGCIGKDTTCTKNHVKADTTVNAKFEQNGEGKVTVTVSGDGNGSGTVKDVVGDIDCTISAGAATGTCSKEINKDGSFNITAAAADGSVFEGWSGACSGADEVCEKNHVMENADIVAKFSGGTSHKGCNSDNQCVDIDGDGDGSCEEDSQCTGEHHLACNDSKQCVSVDGAGDDECSDNSNCGDEPPGIEGSVKLNLKLVFQGILGKPKTDTKLPVKVTVQNKAGDEKSTTADFTVDDKGVWTGTAGLDLADASDYIVLVKGPKHLQKKVCEGQPKETAKGTYRCSQGAVSLKAGDNDLDFSGISLLVGDLPQQDGVVDSYDTSLVRNLVSQTVEQRTSVENLALADLNLDGIVDSQDYSLVIAALSVKYDEE